MRATNHWSEPMTAPFRRAGTSPALTTDDFPLPEGPTTASSRDLGSGSAIRSTS